MEEFQSILKKYNGSYVNDKLTSVAGVNEFAIVFYKDVAEIYDCITRIKNPDRNPTGFSFDDAPILGLLVRTWKLLKEVIKYYEQNNAEMISILDRPLIEASIVASYLMMNDASIVEDYRKCSYKNRLRILANPRKAFPRLICRGRARRSLCVYLWNDVRIDSWLVERIHGLVPPQKRRRHFFNIPFSSSGGRPVSFADIEVYEQAFSSLAGARGNR